MESLRKRSRSGEAGDVSGPVDVKRVRCGTPAEIGAGAGMNGRPLGPALRLQVDSASVWGLEGGSQVWKVGCAKCD